MKAVLEINLFIYMVFNFPRKMLLIYNVININVISQYISRGENEEFSSEAHDSKER